MKPHPARVHLSPDVKIIPAWHFPLRVYGLINCFATCSAETIVQVWSVVSKNYEFRREKESVNFDKSSDHGDLHPLKVNESAVKPGHCTLEQRPGAAEDVACVKKCQRGDITKPEALLTLSEILTPGSQQWGITSQLSAKKVVGRRRQVSAKYSPKHVREGAYNLTRKGNYRRRLEDKRIATIIQYMKRRSCLIHTHPERSNRAKERICHEKLVRVSMAKETYDSNPARRDADALYGCMVLIVLHGVRSYRGSKDLRNAPAKGDMSAIMLLNEKETKKSANLNAILTPVSRPRGGAVPGAKSGLCGRDGCRTGLLLRKALDDSGLPAGKPDLREEVAGGANGEKNDV
ncbi:hypothetical protein EDD17DRAFT_1502921 [Pisolithus thermaeus]|nr:hypothetical protein EDD17DRAFT_1502921 [Pisolithus thermaeus]